MWKEAVVAFLRDHGDIFLEKLRETTKKINAEN
jgi:hypothetical protein